MAAALVELQSVKDFLRVQHDDDDTMLNALILAASTAVVLYCEAHSTDWTDVASTPPDVQTAITLLVGSYYDNGTAGDQTNEVAMGYFPVAVTSLLHRYRKPVMS